MGVDFQNDDVVLTPADLRWITNVISNVVRMHRKMVEHQVSFVDSDVNLMKTGEHGEVKEGRANPENVESIRAHSDEQDVGDDTT